MPLNKYFSGHGEEVMTSMQKEYGADKGKRVFYATSNKRKKKKPKSAATQAKALG